MGRLVACVAVLALLCFVGAAEAAVPGSTTGGTYTVRIGADSTAGSGEPWESVSGSAERLRSGTNGVGAYFVMGNPGVDPQFGDRQGWRLTLPPGVRLTTFSIDALTGGWVARRWTSGLRYTLTATDADGSVLGSPFLSCQPTAVLNDCPESFKSSADRTFTAPVGTRRIEFMVECVLPGGCSRFASPDGGSGAGGNEYAAVRGGTFTFVDESSPALTVGSGELWTQPGRWFHNAETAAAVMGATDNTGVSRLRWYVDGALAYDSGGATSVFTLSCDYSFLKPCGDSSAAFFLDRSLFTIPDGVHSLAVVAVDAAGNLSPALTRQFRVDDSAPPKVEVGVREGSALRDPGPWHLDFTVPSELGAAPLESAWYRFCAASDANDCGPAEPVRDGIDGLAPGDFASVAVSPPSQGEWTVRLWLADRAGNVDEANASDPVLIRYGQSAPVADPEHPPALSGDFVDGGRVRVSASGFSVAGAVSYSFQWQRCELGGGGCADVVGASGQSYVLVHADAGHRMRARVMASNAKGAASAVSVVSVPVGLLAPSAGGALLTGAMRAESALHVAEVAFDGTPPFDLSYAWLRCSSGVCDVIAGADGASYVLGDDDVGQTIRAVVTASNAAGSSSAEASREGEEEVVTPAPPRSVGVPAAPSGPLVVGSTLVAGEGSWEGSRPMTFAYVWQRCAGASGGCTAIPGATERSYSLAGGDAGRTLRVLVTARNGGDPVGPVASARTGAIEAAPAAPEEEGPPPPPVDAPAGSAPAAGPAEAPAAPAPVGPAQPPAAPAAPAADLSKIPGNLVGAGTCKVVRTSPKRRSVRVPGVGRVTFAAAVPQRVTAADPLVLTLKAAKRRVRSVSYRVGRRTVGRSRRSPYRVAVKPKSLQVGGTQVLTALVTPRKKGKPGRVTMKLNVAECPSLLTAGVRFSGGRAVTQMRVFARTSILAGTITLPAKLVPAARAGKRAGTLTLTGADGRPTATALVAGSRGRLLARGGIAVSRAGRRVSFGGIPAGMGVVQIDLFGPRRVALRLLRGRKPLRFTAKVSAERIPQQRLLATVKPGGRR